MACCLRSGWRSLRRIYRKSTYRSSSVSSRRPHLNAWPQGVSLPCHRRPCSRRYQPQRPEDLNPTTQNSSAPNSRRCGACAVPTAASRRSWASTNDTSCEVWSLGCDALATYRAVRVDVGADLMHPGLFLHIPSLPSHAGDRQTAMTCMARKPHTCFENVENLVFAGAEMLLCGCSSG
jgi:hypothetical protein